LMVKLVLLVLFRVVLQLRRANYTFTCVLILHSCK
jgi:hypothetical protein